MNLLGTIQALEHSGGDRYLIGNRSTMTPVDGNEQTLRRAAKSAWSGRQVQLRQRVSGDNASSALRNHREPVPCRVDGPLALYLA
jgi:hypothetical protein